MTQQKNNRLRFGRLTEISTEELVAHMSDERLRAHMPLLTGTWDAPRIRDFVAAKEARWQEDGLGHWAFFKGDTYVGWGGFEAEGSGDDKEWDYGLVLRPDFFGLGPAITREALRFAVARADMAYVTCLLPPTRRKLGALKRFGAADLGLVTYAGERFRKFRVETPSRDRG